MTCSSRRVSRCPWAPMAPIPPAAVTARPCGGIPDAWTTHELFGGRPYPTRRAPPAGTLRCDHGALAALPVSTLTPAIVAAMRTVLAAHNALEEGPGGVYERCEQLAGTETLRCLANPRIVKLMTKV